MPSRSITPRVTVDGKFFRLGTEKFYVKGVSYGPFALNQDQEPFAAPEQTARDFKIIQTLGANTLRVYDPPPRWVLDLAEEHRLKLFVDIPWCKHLCFLDSLELREEAREQVRKTVERCAGHPAVFALSVANEIPPDVVRWSGSRQVAGFLEELVEMVHQVDPECLATFTNFPPTEYLQPENLDFLCLNVYLHSRRPFENYLARLQMIAGAKPLVLGEFGIDSIREGEERKCEILEWQIEAAFRGVLAGTVVFSFTDDWVRSGIAIKDWAFGLTSADRQPKKSFATVQKAFGIAPYYPLPQTPKVSVVVASYNGAATLKTCLNSLIELRYPEYEVIVVDDGSTDTTPQIAALFKQVRYVRQSNHGLSAARNTGIAAARGEVIAFLDSDCRADEDWLYYLIGELVHNEFAGIGGHNLLPPEDSPVAAAVMASPGGPAHVMLNDRVAEHVPGCNMAFYKWALEEIGGFDPIYRKAGDDVDVCWRLQELGYKIGFNSGGFVWHYRRSTINAYLRQQAGYGEAEAFLARRHPEYFNQLGGSVWHGRIYTQSKAGVIARPPIIYHGIFASGPFQSLYTPAPALGLMFCTSLEYHVLVTLPLLVLSVPFPVLFPIGLVSFLISAAVCVAAAMQAELPKKKMRIWSRPLIALLFFLQPIVRGWARYKGRLFLGPTPAIALKKLERLPSLRRGRVYNQVEYWSETPLDRLEFVSAIMEALDQQGWQIKSDSGWNEFDVEIYGNRWTRLQLTTVAEPMGKGKQLFRCRLRTFWSLPALLIFWCTLAFELLVIGVLREENYWLWMLILTQPFLMWWLDQEAKNLRRLIISFLDEIARGKNLVSVDHEKNPRGQG